MSTRLGFFPTFEQALAYRDRLFALGICAGVELNRGGVSLWRVVLDTPAPAARLAA